MGHTVTGYHRIIFGRNILMMNHWNAQTDPFASSNKAGVAHLRCDQATNVHGWWRIAGTALDTFLSSNMVSLE